MRLNRPSVAAMARKSLARTLHAPARKLARARSTDRIIAQRVANAAECCGRIDGLQLQRLANCTLAHSTRTP
eukprot:313596-Lingulodinium_polyedra.AAC.1